MYRWVVFLHVLSAFVFIGAHGISIGVTLALRRERDLARLRAMLDFSRASQRTSNSALIMILLTGIAAGWIGDWWRYGWIWLSLGLLLLSLAPGIVAISYFRQIRRAIDPSNSDPDTLANLDALVSGPEPLWITLPGIAILAAIVWLMIFKPF